MPFIEGKTNGELRLRNDYSVLESEVMRSPIGIVVVVTDWWMWLRTDGFSFAQADVVSDGANHSRKCKAKLYDAAWKAKLWLLICQSCYYKVSLSPPITTYFLTKLDRMAWSGF